MQRPVSEQPGLIFICPSLSRVLKLDRSCVINSIIWKHNQALFYEKKQMAKKGAWLGDGVKNNLPFLNSTSIWRSFQITYLVLRADARRVCGASPWVCSEAHCTADCLTSSQSDNLTNKTLTLGFFVFFWSESEGSAKTNKPVKLLHRKAFSSIFKTDLNVSVKSCAKRKRNLFDPLKWTVRRSFLFCQLLHFSIILSMNSTRKEEVLLRMGIKAEIASVRMCAFKGVCFDRKDLVAAHSCR